MRFRSFFISSISFLTLTLMNLVAESTIYIGSGAAKGASGKISVARFDSATGNISDLREVYQGDSPTFLASNLDKTILYAAIEKAEGSVAAWKVEPDGALRELNRQPTSGRGTCHVSVTPSGKWLLSADYSSGNAAVFPIQKDGSIGVKTAHVQLVGSGPNPQRQKQPHAHGIYSDPEEKFVYVVDLGTDRVWIYAFDSQGGKLTPAKPDAVLLTPGTGPRHLAFSKNGDFVFVNGELDLVIHSLKRNRETGELTPLGNWPILPPEDIAKKASTAEIFVHPQGGFVTVSTRTVDALVTFSISDDGTLAKVSEVPADVKVPRYFGFSPDGKWLLAAGQNDGRIVVFSVNQDTGELTRNGHEVSVQAPMAIEFLDL